MCIFASNKNLGKVYRTYFEKVWKSGYEKKNI